MVVNVVSEGVARNYEKCSMRMRRQHKSEGVARRIGAKWFESKREKDIGDGGLNIFG